MAKEKKIRRPILEGKKALVVGIANEDSIAYGCARAFHELGAEVAITYPWKKVAEYLGFDTGSSLLQLMSTEYKFAVSFVILIVVLLFRPTGLFRGKAN